jgi:hypothetical protein
MGTPKRKHSERLPSAPRPSPAEREASEDLADAEELTRDVAEWEAEGRPPGVPLDELKRRYGMK